MQVLSHFKSHILGNNVELFQALVIQVGLIHYWRILDETQLLIRFENGYGVAVLPVLIEGNNIVFEMLVLGFHGPENDDYHIVQYAPVPEFNCGFFKEIVAWCRRVSLLPKYKTATFPSGNSWVVLKRGKRKVLQ